MIKKEGVGPPKFPVFSVRNSLSINKNEKKSFYSLFNILFSDLLYLVFFFKTQQHEVMGC